MAKIRSPLTPQGEEVMITARMGGPQQYDPATPSKPQTHHLNKKSVVTPWVVVVVLVYWTATIVLICPCESLL